MTKILNKATGAIMLSAALVPLFASCAGKDETEWSIGDGVTAYFSDNGRYGYILNIEGDGSLPDYATEKDAPWYGKSGRITDIVVSDGITYIGDNCFSDCAAKTVVIPRSVTSIGENAFSDSTVICAYNAVTVADGASVCLYSEGKPSQPGSFWRFRNGVATVWETVRVLFIGNSFTYYSDIPSLFGYIADSAGELVVVESVTCGSWNLTKFADVNDEYGRQIDEKLSSASDYDAVVLQEQSTRPLTNYTAFLTAVKTLKTKIDKTQDDCDVCLYSTWGYAEAAAEYGKTIPELEQSIYEKYALAAEEIKADVCRVGAAFSTVYIGYPDINLYHEDNKHPSYSGAFLSACVHAATILGCDPRAASYTGELDRETADILKQVAYETVFGS